MNNNITEIDLKLFQAIALKKNLKILEEQHNILKEEIKHILTAMGVNKYEDDQGNRITYNEVTRNSLDKKMVEKKLAPEIFSECFKQSTFNTLSILSKEEVERRKKFVEKAKEE